MGPNEAALMKALEAEPGAMRRQARAWDKAAEDLRLVAERVRTKQAQLQAAWPSGDDGAAATAAFATLAENVETQATRMDRAAESYRTAADTVTTAKSNYGSLPTPPAGGAALGEGATPRQVEHANEANAAGKAEREAKAGEYLRQMNDGFRDASAEMKAAAPFDQGIKEIEEDDHTDTQGGTGGGSYTSPGSGGTGPYSTSTSGTFAGSAVGISMLGGRPVLGGTIRPGNGQGVGNDDATADGVVGGTVPGADGGTGGTGGTGSAGGSVLGGSAGLGGGTGGAMGAGGAAALLGGGKGLLGKVGGGAAGRAAGAAGASARAGASGASAKGGAIGGKSAGASKGVLGGRSAGTTGGAGQTAGGRGGAAGGRGGMAGGQQAGARGGAAGGRGGAAGGRAGGAAGRSAGAAGRPTAGGMQAGGRSTAAGGSGKAAGGSAAGRSGGAAGAKGTPGSSNATGARNGGAGTRGAAGRGTGPGSTGQGGRGTQRGSDDAVDKRKAMVMAEDWLDDDDVAPDVIQ